jgi:formylglycine-generating enzyme
MGKMKRTKVGSLVVVGATLFMVMGPSAQSDAQAGGPEPRLEEKSDGPSRVAASTSKDVAANAGLKNIATAEIGTTGSCPGDMVEVEGDYCPEVEQKCLKWIDPEGAVPRRCAEFAPTGPCQGKTTHKKFCMDRYEWPNKLGAKPVVMKTWYEAADSCKAVGKRLCGDSEWTLACEGQERLPYPYGYERTEGACNVDKPHPDVNEKAMANPMTRDAEVARLWQGEASGSRESCVSPYGAFDMTGNVDEWVVNESGVPYKSGLKGGYWGPVRNRCRPMTTAHYEQFVFYQIGFRCCADSPDAPSAKNTANGANGKAPAAAKTPAPSSTGSTIAGS